MFADGGNFGYRLHGGAAMSASDSDSERTDSFLDTFYRDDTFLLVDPVMGDNGERFSIFSSEFQQEMKELAARADIATPNLTELCLLSGEDTRLAADIVNEKEALETAKQMAGDLIASVVAGGRARGDALEDSVKLAGEMIGKAIADSVRGNVPRDEGVDYEKYLWMLNNPSF